MLNMAKVNQAGRMIVIVGPSGAGKDRIIKTAQSLFAAQTDVHFVRRVITRPCKADAEIHDSVSVEEFKRMLAAGEFAVHWQANGLYYGLPAATHDLIREGAVLIANGSRAALPALREAYGDPLVVHVNAEPEVLARRLAERKREDTAAIRARLQRNAQMPPLDGEFTEIDNSSELSVAVDTFAKIVQSQRSADS